MWLVGAGEMALDALAEGPKYGPLHPLRGPQPWTTQLPGDLMPSS